MIPSPSEYRLNDDQINRSGAICMARVLGDYLTCDTRWKPHVYYEAQCERSPVTGKDLCKTCGTREQRKHKLWIGRITEDPLPHCHMLGTEWSKKCKWVSEEAVVVQEPVVLQEPVVMDTPATTEVEDLPPITQPEENTTVPSVVESLPPNNPDPSKYTYRVMDIVSVALITLSVGFTVYHFLWANKPVYRWTDSSL